MFFSSFKKFIVLILVIPFFFIPSREFFLYINKINHNYESSLKVNSYSQQEIVQNPTINLFDYATINGGQSLQETLYNFTFFNVNASENFESINFLLKNPDNYENTFTVSWNGNSQSTTIDALKANDYVLDLTTLLAGFDFNQEYNQVNAPIIKISLKTKDGKTIEISFDYLTTSYQPVLSPLSYQILGNQIEVSTYITYAEDVISFSLFENGVDITSDERVSVSFEPVDPFTYLLVFNVDYGESFNEIKTVSFFIETTWNDGYDLINQEVRTNVLNIDLQKKSPTHANIAIIIGSISAVIFSIVIIIILIMLFKHSKNKTKKKN